MSYPLAKLGRMDQDRVIARLARRQHGLVEWSQLERAGVTRSVLRARAQLGILEPAQARVYRVAGSPRTWEQAVLAACLSAGPDAAASHRAAARLWELGAFGAEVDIVMPRKRATDPVGVVAHRSGDLIAADVTVRHGIPVTHPARTLVDLGAVCSRRVVDDAVDAALARRLVTIDGLWQILIRVSKQGRNGCGVLRESLEWRFGVPDSVLEALFLQLVRDFGLPEPVVQYRVVVGGRERRVDSAYPDRLLAVELDGAAKRMSPDALAEDISRQNDFVEAGWTFLRFGFVDLTIRRQRTARLVLDVHRRLARNSEQEMAS